MILIMSQKNQTILSNIAIYQNQAITIFTKIKDFSTQQSKVQNVQPPIKITRDIKKKENTTHNKKI